MNEYGVFYPAQPTPSSRWCTYGNHWVEYDSEGRKWNGYWCPDCQRERERGRRGDTAAPTRRKGAFGVSKTYRMRARRMGAELPEISRATNYACRYWRHMVAKYGLLKIDWVLLYHRQGGVCAICRDVDIAPGAGTTVDHDHHTGKVRGLLCQRCNTLMVVVDDPDWLAAAQAYKAASDGGAAQAC